MKVSNATARRRAMPLNTNEVTTADPWFSGCSGGNMRFSSSTEERAAWKSIARPRYIVVMHTAILIRAEGESVSGKK